MKSKLLIISLIIILISGFVFSLNAFSVSEYSDGDIITFGSYPQSLVTDAEILSSLNDISQSAGWQNFGYYHGSNSAGSEQPDSYMFYCDILYGGEKYRGVTFSKYRPSNNYYTTPSGTKNDVQYEAGYYVDNTYFFRYEPLSWKILDADTGLVYCNNIIDAQAFNDIYIAVESFSSSTLNEYISDKMTDIMFTEAEKEAVNAVDGNLIFLLSRADITNENYGFNKTESNMDENRVADSTDYCNINSLKQHKFSSHTKSTNYWLSDIYESNARRAHIVRYSGSVSFAEVTAIAGVRPAMYLDLDYADKYSLTYNVNGTSETFFYKAGEAISPYLPESEGYKLSDWEPEEPESMPAHNLELSAKWLPRTDTAYKVEIYKQKSDNTYSLETEYKTSTTGETVTAEEYGFEGLELNSNLSTVQTVVEPDGSGVIILYFDRAEFTVTWTIDDTVTVEKYLYLSLLTAPDIPSKTGKTGAWSPLVPDTMPAGNLTFTAVWSDCVHDYILVSHTEPTCTERGRNEYKCEICSLEYSEIIEPNGHTDENSDNICDVCGVMITEQSGLFMSERKLTLRPGSTAALHTSTDFFEIKYMSSDSSIASVDENGTVTAVSRGECTVTSYIEETGESISTVIAVKPSFWQIIISFFKSLFKI